MSQTPPTDPQPEPTEFVWNTAERLVTDDLAATVAESSKQNTDLDMCGARHSIMARNIAEDVIVDLLNAGWVAPDGTRVVTAPAAPTAQMATVDDTALIERAAVALAAGDVDEARYFRDDARAVHERVYGPELAAKDAVIERTGARRAELFVELGQARTELEKARAALAARTRDIDTVWQTYHDDLGRRNRELAESGTELAALRAEAVVIPEDAVNRLDDVRFAWTIEERNAIVEEVRSWRPATEPAEATGNEPSRRVMVTVRFVGGPWDGKTTEVESAVAPVFAAGHDVGNHYWLDTKSDPPAYHWDGADWEVVEQPTEGGRA